MHDYSGYIWPAYILTGFVWGVMTIASLIRSRRWKGRAEK